MRERAYCEVSADPDGLPRRAHLQLGEQLSGTSPGLTVDGHVLPLNPDPYFLFTAAHANSPILPGFAGTLDSLGRATASLVLPPGAGASIVGVTLHHAYAVYDVATSKVTHTSNVVPLLIQP